MAVTVAGAAGLTGCTLSDPTVDGSGRPVPGEGPTPGRPSTPGSTPSSTDSRATADAIRELGLADLVRMILSGPHRKDLSRRQGMLLTFAGQTHRSHATVLAAGAPPPKPASIQGLSLADSLSFLRRREAAAAARYRRTSLAASGSEALRWASMSLAAATLATAAVSDKPPPTRKVTTPPPAALLSDTVATQEMVRQLHATIYGYQLGIGKLEVRSPQYNRAVRELQSHRELRDRLIGWLIRRAADVPAAAAAYVPSVNPSSPGKAGQLIMKMNVALQPFAGLMIAAADDHDRAGALRTLTSVVTTAHGWGAPLSAWPGYP